MAAPPALRITSSTDDTRSSRRTYCAVSIPADSSAATTVTRVSEAIDAGDSIDADDYLYRRMTSSERDLNPVTQERAREVSHYLWRQNPFARRLVEMTLDQVIGDEVAHVGEVR